VACLMQRSSEDGPDAAGADDADVKPRGSLRGCWQVAHV